MTGQLDKRLKGYALTTAEITYRLPDHPSLLQHYVWQELDLPPQFPMLRKFLDFWQQRLDGELHTIRVASRALIRPAEISVKDAEFLIH